MGWRVLNRLKELAQSRKSLKDRIDELRKRIKQLETQPEDESRNHLLNGSRDERSALIELAKNMNARLTLNFFTDEGLLPNYAFPEEGVTLNSVMDMMLPSVSSCQPSPSRDLIVVPSSLKP